MRTMTLSLMIAATLVSCAPRPKPKLGVLPSTVAPPCTDAERKTIPDDECIMRLTAFAGRGMRATVMLHAPVGVGQGTKAVYAGAGVVIDRKGRVLTSYRVIKDLPAVVATLRRVGGAGGKIVYAEDVTVPMAVVSYAEHADLALLEPVGETPMPEPLVVNGTVRSFRQSEKVWLFGSRAVTYGGPVTDPDGYSDGEHVTVGIPAVGRDMGGPVLSQQGEIIGVMTVPASDDAAASFVPVSIAVQLFGLPAVCDRP